MRSLPKILIVDDKPTNLKLLSAHLTLADVLVETAADGVEALERVAEHPPDLVLLDVMMPRMDGFETCRRLKNDERTRMIPVVLVTALDSTEDKVRGIEAGADDFLTKPVNKIELLARTRALLHVKRLNDRVLSLQDQLKSLFEITTFAERYGDRQVLMNEFAHNCAAIANARQMAIVLRAGPEEMFLAGGFNLDAETWEAHRNTMARLAWKTMEDPHPFVLRAQDPAAMLEYDLDGSFAGVPLISHSKTVVGAINAFGIEGELEEETIRVLSIAAQRLSSELQLQDYSIHLESLVGERTRELKQALGNLKAVNKELTIAQQDTIFRLAKAAEYRDEDTAAHIMRMSSYSAVLAEAMGMDKAQVNDLRLASIMHDVGKLGIPDSILQKRGKLSHEEFAIMKEHTLIGSKILSGSNVPVLQMSEVIALCHHEKWDGSGYPHGLAGERIPIEARIVAVCDVFDALTTKRVYKPAFSVEDSLDYIRSNMGSHFDPHVSQVFLDRLDVILAIRDKYPDECTPPFPRMNG